jgi:hypothetical protein
VLIPDSTGRPPVKKQDLNLSGSALHAGRASDQGRIDILVSYRGQTTNLHFFWDTDLVEMETGNEEKIAKRLTANLTAEERVFRGDSLSRLMIRKLAEVVGVDAQRPVRFRVVVLVGDMSGDLNNLPL